MSSKERLGGGTEALKTVSAVLSGDWRPGLNPISVFILEWHVHRCVTAVFGTST